MAEYDDNKTSRSVIQKYISVSCISSSYVVGHQNTPSSAAAPAPLSNVRTYCGPPVKQFASPRMLPRGYIHLHGISIRYMKRAAY